MGRIITQVIDGRKLQESDLGIASGLVYEFVKESRALYPAFSDWYYNKFIPGLVGGSRSIIIDYLCGNIAAVALLKNDGVEKKLCTMKVGENYQRSGIGKRLFEQCLESLNTKEPMITVSGELLGRFSRILDYYGFSLEQINRGYYRDIGTEYVFNGWLKPEYESSHWSKSRIHLTCPR